jgi:hypothetical protein
MEQQHPIGLRQFLGVVLLVINFKIKHFKVAIKNYSDVERASKASTPFESINQGKEAHLRDSEY